MVSTEELSDGSEMNVLLESSPHDANSIAMAERPRNPILSFFILISFVRAGPVLVIYNF